LDDHQFNLRLLIGGWPIGTVPSPTRHAAIPSYTSTEARYQSVTQAVANKKTPVRKWSIFDPMPSYTTTEANRIVIRTQLSPRWFA
jgi:hypothetical protein